MTVCWRGSEEKQRQQRNTGVSPLRRAIKQDGFGRDDVLMRQSLLYEAGCEVVVEVYCFEQFLLADLFVGCVGYVD